MTVYHKGESNKGTRGHIIDGMTRAKLKSWKMVLIFLVVMGLVYVGGLGYFFASSKAYRHELVSSLNANAYVADFFKMIRLVDDKGALNPELDEYLSRYERKRSSSSASPSSVSSSVKVQPSNPKRAALEKECKVSRRSERCIELAKGCLGGKLGECGVKDAVYYYSTACALKSGAGCRAAGDLVRNHKLGNFYADGIKLYRDGCNLGDKVACVNLRKLKQKKTLK